MMDIISINKLKSYCIIGINEKERLKKQEIFVDIELFGNFKNKSSQDSIEHTLNYSTVSNEVLSYVNNSKHFLIETVAEEISKICLKYRQVKKVTIEVHKPKALKNASNVSIKIERNK
jgi:FolB domain-containing protein|tara:strand:- start:843 stop:1196 length:354 start_codon:yes stop_codon:yes gene_type:complete